MRILTTFLLLCGMAFAGSGSAAFYGTVYGADGFPMPGVTVTLEDPSLGVLRHTTTGKDGSWAFGDVPPGKNYKVTATSKDGKVIDIRTGIDIAEGDERVLLPPLKKAAVPFTQQELLDSISGGVSNHRLALIVRRYGIGFDATPETMAMLTQGGATDELLAAVRYQDGISHRGSGQKHLQKDQCELAQKEFEAATNVPGLDFGLIALARCFEKQSKLAEARNVYATMIAKGPDRSIVRRAHAQFLSRTGDLARAIEEYRGVVHRDYDWQDQASLALLLHLQGRLGDAALEYRKIDSPWLLNQLAHVIRAATAQQKGEGEFRIAEAEFAKGRYAAAEEHYRASLNAAPDFLAAARGLQSALRAQNKMEAAAQVEPQIARLMLPFVESAVVDNFALLDRRALVQSYTEELQRNPRSVEAHLGLGHLLLGASAADSEGHFRTALELDPENVEAHLSLAGALGQRPEAVQHVAEADRLKPDDALIQQRIGWILAQKGKGKWGMAEEHLRKAVQLDPDSVYHKLALANFFVWPSGDKARGKELLVQLSRQSPERADLHAMMAQILEPNSPERLAELRKAADLRPSLINVRAYAAALLAAGSYKEAADVLRHEIQLETSSGLFGSFPNSVRWHLADALEGTGDLDGGVALLEFVLKDDPIDGEALRRLGRLLRKQAKLDESTSILRDALLVNGRDAAAHFELAATLEQKKAYVQALAESKAAVDLDPKNAIFQRQYAALRAVGPKPLALAEIEEGLKGGLSNKRLTAMVKEFGVDFATTDEIKQRLRSQGADVELLLTISQAKR